MCVVYLEVSLTFELVNLRERLVCVLVGLLHVARLHGMHHRHQVHQHVQVLFGHPQKHVAHIRTAHSWEYNKITLFY